MRKNDTILNDVTIFFSPIWLLFARLGIERSSNDTILSLNASAPARKLDSASMLALYEEGKSCDPSKEPFKEGKFSLFLRTWRLSLSVKNGADLGENG